MTDSLRVFDLFAGCGGLSLGLEQAGLSVNWANEIDNNAVLTYRHAHPNTSVFDSDANLLFQRLLDNDQGLPSPGEVDVIVGGPPCQGFSGYNRHRSPNDPRNSLVETFLSFINYLQPRYILMENVPGMLSLGGGATIKLLLTALAELGYQSRLGILQAGYYGLPQNRWRVFVWGARDGEMLPDFPQPTHIFPRITIHGATAFRDSVVKPPATAQTLFWSPLPTTTVGDAIKDLPGIENGGGMDQAEYACSPMSLWQDALRQDSTILYDHKAANLGPVMLERCRAVPRRPGAGWCDLPEHLKPRNLVKHGDNRYENRFGRLHWGGNFNTIVSKPEPYWGSVIHPEQDRVISVRESARAQGFPDRVRFFGSLTDRYRQVGNAVPPPLGKALGIELLKAVGIHVET
jgi:DNA (cytosine-5)-methyltransferase 1